VSSCRCVRWRIGMGRIGVRCVIPVGVGPVKAAVWGADLSFGFLRQFLDALS
jgi:hypothetical protein